MSSLPYRTKAKYILLFFTLLGIPSAVLGYLALRGIMNDRALAENELIAEHERAARAVAGHIDVTIMDLEADLLRACAGSGRWDSPEMRLVASQLRSARPLRGYLFITRSAHLLLLPGTQLMYTAEGEARGIADVAVTWQVREDSGAYYEYRRHDYRNALAWYQRELHSRRQPEQQVPVFFAIARCQRALSQIPAAVETYSTLSANYGRASLAGGFPVGLAAELEIAQLASDCQSPDSAARKLRSLLAQLTRGDWLLDRGQYQFAVSEIQSEMREVVSKAGPDSSSIVAEFAAVEMERNQRFLLTERILTFKRDFVPFLLDSLRWNQRRGQTLRQARRVGDFLFGVIATPCFAESDGRTALAGVLLMLDEEGPLFASAVLAQSRLPAKTIARVTDEQGKIIAGLPMSQRARLTIQEKLAGGFPPWVITLFHQDRTVLEELLSSRRSIYVVTLLLVLALLIAGGSLLWRIMAKELELANLQSDFVSMVSHELRSPLTSIRQLAEMLQTNRVPSEERRTQYYDVIVQQSERLSRLVENILDFSRIEQGKLQLDPEELDLQEFVRSIVGTIQNRLLNTALTISVQASDQFPALSVDRQAMGEAITNIIDNAIKYSGDSNVVEIHLFRKADAVCIAVRDYGIGIDKEDLRKVFQKFYRAAHPAGRLVRGSGLGLPLANSIVEAHGGTITAESEPGKGSTFTIVLPLSTNLR